MGGWIMNGWIMDGWIMDGWIMGGWGRRGNRVRRSEHPTDTPHCGVGTFDAFPVRPDPRTGSTSRE